MTESREQTLSQVIVLNRDLLFGSRIRSALTGLGLEGVFVGAADAFVSGLNEHRASVALGIIDMNGEVAWEVIGEAIAKGKSDLVPTLAFGPHVDVVSRRAAKATGITRIVSNGQFHADMAGLIDRYRRR